MRLFKKIICPAGLEYNGIYQKHIDALLKNMGYRFVIEGVAPFYFNWPLAIGLADEQGVVTYNTQQISGNGSPEAIRLIQNLTFLRTLPQVNIPFPSIVNEILDLSKIESGKMEIVETEYNLSKLIADLTAMISLKAESKNLDFHLNLDKSLPVNLYGDDGVYGKYLPIYFPMQLNIQNREK